MATIHVTESGHYSLIQFKERFMFTHTSLVTKQNSGHTPSLILREYMQLKAKRIRCIELANYGHWYASAGKHLIDLIIHRLLFI